MAPKLAFPEPRWGVPKNTTANVARKIDASAGSNFAFCFENSRAYQNMSLP